jgi:hypothetical protein
VIHHPDRSVFSRRASRGFIPEAEQRSPPRRMPSRRSTPGHDALPPFRPSAHPRCGLASPLPRLSALGCLTSFACAGPPRPSADCCRAVREDCSALSPTPDPRQISRGQRSDRPCIDARFIKHRPLWMEDFTGACPLVPTVPHRVSGSCPSPRTFVPRCLQTPPRGDALALPFVLRLHEYLDRGLSPPSMTACTAHTTQLTGRRKRERRRSGRWRRSGAAPG